MFITADCSPACQNGGRCQRSSSNAYCDCPSGYTGSYCQNRGNTCNQTAGAPESIHVVVSYLQPVVPPVRMEEFVLVHLPMLTVAVPVGTQDPTANTKVCTYIRICKSISMYCTYVYSSSHCTYVPMFITADCSPACQNGGRCQRSSSNAYCDCPSGYTGSYCQNRGNTCNQTAGGPESIHVVVSYLQPVVPPVRMEEFVLVHLPMLTVAVPVGT